MSANQGTTHGCTVGNTLGKSGARGRGRSSESRSEQARMPGAGTRMHPCSSTLGLRATPPALLPTRHSPARALQLAPTSPGMRCTKRRGAAAREQQACAPEAQLRAPRGGEGRGAAPPAIARQVRPGPAITAPAGPRALGGTNCATATVGAATTPAPPPTPGTNLVQPPQPPRRLLGTPPSSEVVCVAPATALRWYAPRGGGWYGPRARTGRLPC